MRSLSLSLSSCSLLSNHYIVFFFFCFFLFLFFCSTGRRLEQNARQIALLLHAEAVDRDFVEVPEVEPKPGSERQDYQEQEEKSNDDDEASTASSSSSSFDFDIEPKKLATTPVPATPVPATPVPATPPVSASTQKKKKATMPPKKKTTDNLGLEEAFDGLTVGSGVQNPPMPMVHGRFTKTHTRKKGLVRTTYYQPYEVLRILPHGCVSKTQIVLKMSTSGRQVGVGFVTPSWFSDTDQHVGFGEEEKNKDFQFTSDHQIFISMVRNCLCDRSVRTMFF